MSQATNTNNTNAALPHSISWSVKLNAPNRLTKVTMWQGSAYNQEYLTNFGQVRTYNQEFPSREAAIQYIKQTLVGSGEALYNEKPLKMDEGEVFVIYENEYKSKARKMFYALRAQAQEQEESRKIWE